MGKIDDMRRQREQQFAEAEQREAKAAKAKPAPNAPASAPAVVPVAAAPAPERVSSSSRKSTSKAGAAMDEQGKCPDCNKMKPLANGVLAQHQKGFGKACPGSKKKPL